MATLKKRIDFYTSEEGALTEQALRRMTQDDTFNTTASYSTNLALYTDNLIPFVDKHMNYLRTHPMIEIDHYLANLRLMTRIRPR